MASKFYTNGMDWTWQALLFRILYSFVMFVLDAIDDHMMEASLICDALVVNVLLSMCLL